MELNFKTESWKTKIEKGTYYGGKKSKYNIKLQLRIKELEAADTLFDISSLPHLRLHKLKGDRKFELAIDVDGKIAGERIIFVCLDGEDIHIDRPNPQKMLTVTKIKIIEIGNYHKK